MLRGLARSEHDRAPPDSERERAEAAQRGPWRSGTRRTNWNRPGCGVNPRGPPPEAVMAWIEQTGKNSWRVRYPRPTTQQPTQAIPQCPPHASRAAHHPPTRHRTKAANPYQTPEPGTGTHPRGELPPESLHLSASMRSTTPTKEDQSTHERALPPGQTPELRGLRQGVELRGFEP
jgi:hypothetical protein